MAQIKWYISVYMHIHFLSKYFHSENKSFIEFTPLGYQTGYFRDWDCFELSKFTKNPRGLDSKILLTYMAHHVVYNISITGVIVLSNDMIIDKILMQV